MARAPDCLTSHACVPGSNPAVPMWGFQKNNIVSPLSMLLGDHFNGGLVELRLRPELMLLMWVALVWHWFDVLVTFPFMRQSSIDRAHMFWTSETYTHIA